MRHTDGTKVTTEEMIAIAVEMGHDEADLRTKMGASHKEAMARTLVRSIVEGEMLGRREFVVFTATPANHIAFEEAFEKRFGRKPTEDDR